MSTRRWLFLDFHEEADHRTIWFWRDLATDESSQDFLSEEAAFEALRNDELEFLAAPGKPLAREE